MLRAGTEALEKLEPEILSSEYLVSLLRDKDEKVRIAAVKGLGN